MGQATSIHITANTRPNENLTGIGSKFSSRIALGYSREKNYFGVYFISDTYEMNLSKSENIQFLITNYYMFYSAFRFKQNFLEDKREPEHTIAYICNCSHEKNT